MREIKFRAWDINKKKYYYGVQNTYESIIGDSFGNILNDDELIVEEFTGIKDKNGVEIYEGDIICQQMRFVETNSVIFWQEDKARFAVNLEGFITTITKPQEHSYEVIGNIHENADLLEEQS